MTRIKALNHKWERVQPEYLQGVGCERPGCAVRIRFRRETGKRGTSYREEMSPDGGLTWKDLKRELGGRRLPCGAGQ